jgi:hypothetical protein
MRFVCDAPGGAVWFAIETLAEAEAEAALMQHAVDRHFIRAHAAAAASFTSADPHGIGRDIGLKAHVLKTMPLFLTLRDGEGAGLATAMLPPQGRPTPRFRLMIVGPNNADPYPQHGAAIMALSRHFGIELPRAACFPYG